MNPIPILDLTRARRRIDLPLRERWSRILDANAFIQGPEVQELERAFAAFLGAPAVVGVANGTDALTIALRALGLAHGAEVLVPAFSFFATAEAVVLAGGVPVFCDIDAATYNLDPQELERHATAKTAGVIGVHLYGRPFDVESVAAICQRRGWFLLEDAAQAHGARRRGRRAGTLGDLAAWSFYPTKNLGCFGDGGAVSGRDEALLERVHRLANHGQSARYTHVEIGTNSRLDSLQAAVLNCRLPLLDDDNARRRKLAALYQESLAGVGRSALPIRRPAGRGRLPSDDGRHRAPRRTAGVPQDAGRRLGGALPVGAASPEGDGGAVAEASRSAASRPGGERGALPADVPGARRERGRARERRGTQLLRPQELSLRRRTLGALLVATAALRLAHLAAVRDAPFVAQLALDSQEYDRWARALAAGDWLGSAPFFQAPLYPYLVALVYRFLALSDGAPLAVYLLQIGAAVLACWALVRTGEALAGPRAGGAAGCSSRSTRRSGSTTCS